MTQDRYSPAPEAPWLIRVDGSIYRWTIWADDDGLELRVLDNDRGGSLLVVRGLSFQAGSSNWQAHAEDTPRFTTLPEDKVAQLIRQAREQGWRFDLEDQSFTLEPGS